MVMMERRDGVSYGEERHAIIPLRAIGHGQASPLRGLVEKVFVIGGATVYEQALSSPLLDTAYCTRVEGEFECDVSVLGLATLDDDGDRFVRHDVGGRHETDDGVAYQICAYDRVLDAEDAFARSIALRTHQGVPTAGRGGRGRGGGKEGCVDLSALEWYGMGWVGCQRRVHCLPLFIANRAASG